MVIQWTNEKSIHSGRKVGTLYPAIFGFVVVVCKNICIDIATCMCIYVNVGVRVNAYVLYVCAPGLEHTQKTHSLSFSGDMNKQCLILLCFREYYLVLHYLTQSLGSFF